MLMIVTDELSIRASTSLPRSKNISIETSHYTRKCRNSTITDVSFVRALTLLCYSEAAGQEVEQKSWYAHGASNSREFDPVGCVGRKKERKQITAYKGVQC